MAGPSDVELEAMALLEQAYELPEEEQEDFIHNARDHDRAVRDHALALLRADRMALHSLRTGGAGDGAVEDLTPPEIPGYRIVRQLGRGGMGAVWLAEREGRDFDHLVAIKVIKPGVLHESLIERFRRERQILARLNHPNIAHLHDGGEMADGRPFIVMEYVRGRTLRQWLEEEKPPLERRLEMFRQIALAVAFAHQNLVIHRDLTPSNVLVTEQDQAKLIDFGIARPQEPDTVNQEGSRFSGLSLTPGYAAPERARGEASNTLADVYSLGKVLALMAAPETPPELAAIARKAAAEEPAERYASAAELAEEVDRYTGNEPVAAYSTALPYRLRKFIIREKALVALFAVLLAGLAGTSWAYQRAEQARAEAEMRFEQTRAIAKTMLFDAFDEVSRVPGSTQARATLAESGLEYLDALAADPDAPVDVRLEVGNGYARLAEVVGSNRSSSLGRLKEAGVLLKQANDVLEPLHAQNPDSLPVTIAYADLLSQYARHQLYNEGKFPEGRAMAEKAHALIKAHATDSLETAKINAQALTAIGDAYGWEDEYAKGIPYYEQAETFLAGLPAKMRDSTGLRQVRAQNLRVTGEAYHNVDREAEARAVLDRAVAINEEIVAADPDDPRKMRGLIVVLWYSAVVDRTEGRDAAARAAIDRAVSLVEGLQARNPGDADMATLFVTVAEVKAQILADSRDYAQSYALTDRIVETNREKVRVAENAPGARRALAQVLRTGGTNHHNGGDFAGACVRWKEAMSIWQDLKRKGEISGLDRTNMTEMTEYLRLGCDPPREITE